MGAIVAKIEAAPKPLMFVTVNQLQKLQYPQNVGIEYLLQFREACNSVPACEEFKSTERPCNHLFSCDIELVEPNLDDFFVYPGNRCAPP
jgi:hypothetical protein